jgi:hypothetical protein
MNTIVYNLSPGTYSARQEIIDSLNAITGITAELKVIGYGKGEILITVPDDFSLVDAVTMGAYIGQIETMHYV